MNFVLIGDGKIAGRHKEAIKYIGGDLIFIHDTKKRPNNKYNERKLVDYAVICSPTDTHLEYIKALLKHHPKIKIICEKPMCLPWETLLDDDRINIVLQLRYLNGLPGRADLIKVTMIRDNDYWSSWKGNPKLTGGYMFEFFIHYVDLAIQLNASFEGLVLKEGEGERSVYWGGPLDIYTNKFDITKCDMQDCYNRMYKDIIDGNGIKPKELFYLHWILNRHGKDEIDKKIIIDKKDL